MARCVSILLLPTLLSLCLLADAGYNLLQPGEQQVDKPLVLHDAFERNTLRLPSEKKNEMIKDVPLFVGRPWDRHQVSSATLRKYRPRAENQESGFESRGSSFGHSRKRFPPREQNHPPHGYGQEQWEGRFPRAEEHKRGRYEKHEYTHGGEKKFEHFREDHVHFLPQFSRPSSFPSSEEESVSSSFGSFPREFRPRPENEESGFESRERAFKPFPEREHHYPHRHGQGGGEWEFPRGEDHNHGSRYERHEYPHGGEMKFRHGDDEDHFHFRPQLPRPSRPFPRSWVGDGEREHHYPHRHGQGGWEFPRGEDHNHGRYDKHEYPHEGEMKFRHRGDHFHFRPQLPRPSSFPCSRDHGKEVISSFRNFSAEFRPRAENEKPGFDPRERDFECIGKGFPDRKHGHDQGQWEWEFPNGEEHKHERHERHEYSHGGKMKFRRFWGDGPRGDQFRFRPQFPRPPSFPSSGDHGKEGISSSFGSFHGEVRPQAENEKFVFEPRERAFEHIVGKPGFSDKQHSHDQRSFLGADERHEDSPAPWTDLLKSLFRGH